MALIVDFHAIKRALDGGSISPIEALHNWTTWALKVRTLELKPYFEYVRETLPIVTWHQPGEELLVHGYLPVTWTCPMDFYQWADNFMGQVFSMGAHLRRYIAEEDQEQAASLLEGFAAKWNAPADDSVNIPLSAQSREQKAAAIYSNGRDCVMKGGNSLRSLARHIKTVVFGNEEMEGPLWRARQWPDQTITLDRFEDYLLKPAREGLGIPDFAWLLDVLQAHPEKGERDDAIKAVIHEIPDFIDRAEVIKRKREVKEATRQTDPTSKEFVKRGGDRKSEGIKVSNTDFDPKPSSEKNSKPGTLRRLARSHPDLLARVESGELSAHAAAVQAGIRKPMKSIPVDSAESAIRALARMFPVTDLENGIKALVIDPQKRKPATVSPVAGREVRLPIASRGGQHG